MASTSSGSGGCVVLFTKPAVPGRVKTRLIGALSAAQAAELHAAFLGDLSERLADTGWALWTAWDLEAGERPALELLAGRADAVLAQRGDDLGERLHHALSLAVAAGFDRVAAVGSDHPTLPRSRLAECDARLASGADVVLGPAADGGYYLIACRSEALSPSLFAGIAWSTAEVLRQTRERCAAEGLRVELLDIGHDVDLPADLDRLRRELAERPGRCPRTERLLSRWQELGTGGGVSG